jgi:hypothetical protein
MPNLSNVNNTSTLAKKLRHMDQIFKDMIEIELHPNSINTKDGFSLNRSWKPLICNLREQEQALNKDKTPSGGP